MSLLISVDISTFFKDELGDVVVLSLLMLMLLLSTSLGNNGDIILLTSVEELSGSVQVGLRPFTSSLQWNGDGALLMSKCTLSRER